MYYAKNLDTVVNIVNTSLLLTIVSVTQTIFKVFRGGQVLFTDSREGLEKIEKKVPKKV